MEPDLPHFNLSKENQAAETPNKEQYKEMLAASLNLGEQSRILAFKHKAPAPPEGHVSHLAPLYTNNLGQAPSRKHYRHIPQTQERILDAPDLVDDYYLNLVDWSSGNQASTLGSSEFPASCSCADVPLPTAKHIQTTQCGHNDAAVNATVGTYGSGASHPV
jgi:cell division cycle protein 20 (cofactor of APC complex)